MLSFRGWVTAWFLKSLLTACSIPGSVFPPQSPLGATFQLLLQHEPTTHICSKGCLYVLTFPIHLKNQYPKIPQKLCTASVSSIFFFQGRTDPSRRFCLLLCQSTHVHLRSSDKGPSNQQLWGMLPLTAGVQTCTKSFSFTPLTACPSAG